MQEFGPPPEYDFQDIGATTGRSLVVFEEDAEAGLETLRSVTSGTVATATAKRLEPKEDGALVFEELGVAVVSAPADELREAGVAAEGGPGILAVEPERIVYALETIPGGGRSAEYLRGYRDAVLHLTDGAAGPLADGAAGADAAARQDESQTTWGIQAVKAANSCRSGQGIRIAVLDTGFDSKHVDFAGRRVTSQSFVPGESAEDGHGHGTHCIGTAAGPKCPRSGPRYGVAYESEIFSGKVLSNAGSGTDGQILGGINWALANRCAVVSMSLGAPTRVGQPFSRVFERVAQRASQAGCLIIAAAGNDSRRPEIVNPVSHPANCPSIMAVAAVDVSLAIARFSNRGLNPAGGQVDAAGPGVDVYSSWPMPTGHRRLNGTSMATPHAAGVAALLAEANPGVHGAALGALVVGAARRMPHLPSADVGAGLVQAP
jgi:subtilisin family serine protease